MENRFLEAVKRYHGAGNYNLRQLSALEIIEIALIYFEEYKVKNNKIDNIITIIKSMEELIKFNNHQSTDETFIKAFVIQKLNHTFYDIEAAFAKGGAQ